MSSGVVPNLNHGAGPQFLGIVPKAATTGLPFNMFPNNGGNGQPGTPSGSNVGFNPSSSYEGLLNTGQAGMATTPGTPGYYSGGYADPRPGLIAAAQKAANAESVQVGGLYDALSKQLGLGVGQGDASYAAADKSTVNNYAALKNSVANNYGSATSSLDAEMQRLGQGQLLGQQHAKASADQNWLTGLIGAQGQGARDSLGIMGHGEHDYNTAVTGMAKTEGANRKADIIKALAKQVATISAGKGGSAGTFHKGTGPTSTRIGTKDGAGGFLSGYGAAGKAVASALQSWIGSEDSQNGMKANVDMHQKGPNGEIYKDIPNNPANIYASLAAILDKQYHNPGNKSTLHTLAQIAAEKYKKKGLAN